MRIGDSRTAIAEALTTVPSESEQQSAQCSSNCNDGFGPYRSTLGIVDGSIFPQPETIQREGRSETSPDLRSVPEADDIAEHYEQAAGEYRVWSPEGYLHAGLWQWGSNPFHRRGMLEATNRIVFNELALGDLANGLVADLGCGYGSVANYGATLFPKLDWLGVSLSGHQVDTGRQTVAPRVTLQKSDYHSLDLPDKSFSAAYFLESFCYSYDPRGLFSEMQRLLIPGRRLTIVDGMLNRPWSSIRGVPRWLAKKAASGWAIAEFPEVASTLRFAKEAGLELINVREVGMRTWPNMLNVPWLTAQRFWANRTSRSLHSNPRPGSQNNASIQRHLVACLSGAAMSLFRRHFGYYILTWKRN